MQNEIILPSLEDLLYLETCARKQHLKFLHSLRINRYEQDEVDYLKILAFQLKNYQLKQMLLRMIVARARQLANRTPLQKNQALEKRRKKHLEIKKLSFLQSKQRQLNHKLGQEQKMQHTHKTMGSKINFNTQSDIQQETVKESKRLWSFWTSFTIFNNRQKQSQEDSSNFFSRLKKSMAFLLRYRAFPKYVEEEKRSIIREAQQSIQVKPLLNGD